MPYLLAVTVLWAFSFSLIGVYLAGKVDPYFSAFLRVALATLVFLPFIKFKNITARVKFKLMAIGAIQLGLMYGFYYNSFIYLTVPEVLLFTILTPIYITILNDIFIGKFNKNFFITASIAVAGAFTIRFSHISSDYIFGFFLIQGANLCFAVGQVTYKRLIKQLGDIKQHEIFGWFFIGAFILATLLYALLGDPNKLPTTVTQWGVLIYLGIMASGIGYFIWNKGATIVDVGTLAVMNNLLIPAGIIVNVLIWNKEADIIRLVIGGAIIASALLINTKLSSKK